MDVRLTYEVEFSAITVLENVLKPNVYECKLDFLTNSDDPELQSIAFERMKFMFVEIFDGCVFIDFHSEWLKAFAANQIDRIVLLPEPGYDQVIGMALFQKINAIMEDHIYVHELTIKSRVGGSVGYVVDDADDFTDFEKATATLPGGSDLISKLWIPKSLYSHQAGRNWIWTGATQKLC